MEILNVRIDDRLVHGVVATYWIPSLKVDRVIAIDKESAENPMLKGALRMATPKAVSLSVIDTQKTIDNLLSNRYGNEKIMIVTKSPKTIIELIDAGIKINTLTMGNLGNIEKAADRVVLTKYISVTPGDIKDLDYIKEKGVAIESQLIPNDPAEDFYALMKKKIQ